MPVILAVKRQRWNQEFKVIPSYVVSLRLTLKSYLKKKLKKERKEKGKLTVHTMCEALPPGWDPGL